MNLVGIAGPETDYVKRVIGVPGDHVVCCNAQGQVTVNGVPLSETSYIYPGAAPSQIRFNITVPPGRLWVMGDNRGGLRRLPLPGRRSRRRDHPGERRRGPGVPDHLAVLPRLATCPSRIPSSRRRSARRPPSRPRRPRPWRRHRGRRACSRAPSPWRRRRRRQPGRRLGQAQGPRLPGRDGWSAREVAIRSQ